MPQLVPSQVAYPFAGVVHAVHEVPQVDGEVLLAQAPPQSWYPELQPMPQPIPSQVAYPFAGVAHGVHEIPQVAIALLLTQAPLQLW